MLGLVWLRCHPVRRPGPALLPRHVRPGSFVDSNVSLAVSLHTMAATKTQISDDTLCATIMRWRLQAHPSTSTLLHHAGGARFQDITRREARSPTHINGFSYIARISIAVAPVELDLLKMFHHPPGIKKGNNCPLKRVMLCEN